jgi:hypothetical protein
MIYSHLHFPDSEVIAEKSAFNAKYDENKHQYLVLNYDKFSQEDSINLILNLVKERIDFVILDEIHQFLFSGMCIFSLTSCTEDLSSKHSSKAPVYVHRFPFHS